MIWPVGSSQGRSQEQEQEQEQHAPSRSQSSAVPLSQPRFQSQVKPPSQPKSQRSEFEDEWEAERAILEEERLQRARKEKQPQRVVKQEKKQWKWYSEKEQPDLGVEKEKKQQWDVREEKQKQQRGSNGEKQPPKPTNIEKEKPKMRIRDELQRMAQEGKQAIEKQEPQDVMAHMADDLKATSADEHVDDSELMDALIEGIGRITIGMRMDDAGRWRIVRETKWEIPGS